MPKITLALTEQQLDAIYTHAVLMCLRYTTHEEDPTMRSMWHALHQAASDLGAVAHSSARTITYDPNTGRRTVRVRLWDDD